MRRRWRLRFGILTAAALVWVLPMAAVLVFAFAPNADILRGVLLPSSLTWANIATVLTEEIRGVSVPRALLNSAVILLIQVTGILLLDIPAAYAFARLRFPGRDAIFALLLVSMMMPGIMELVSLYEMMASLGLVDTLPALVLPGLPRVIGIFMLRQFFLAVPKELEEAARIDGAGEWQVFRRVMIPVARPAIITLAVISALYSWNNFTWPLVISNSPDSMPVPVAMAYLQSGTSAALGYTSLLAAAFVTSLPIIVLFLLGQRWIVSGMRPTAGIK